MSHDRKAIAKDYNNNHLLVIEDEILFDVDPFQSTVRKVKSNKKFKYVVSDKDSKSIYLITTEYDEDAENPYSNILCIKHENGFKDLFKFSSEVTVNDIEINHPQGLVYIIAHHNDVEDEHGIWIFRALTK